MKVYVTLKYLHRTKVEISLTEEVDAGTTAGELSSKVLADHEKQEGIHFTGANVAVLVNGRLSAREMVLNDGDEMKIIPVAAGG